MAPPHQLLDPSQPVEEGLQAQQQKLAGLGAAYWRALCPALHAGDAAFQAAAAAAPLELPQSRTADLRAQVDREGVAQLAPHELPWAPNLGDMAAAAARLQAAGWPPSFLLMYDEPWAVVGQAAALLAASTGNACNFDILAWYVDPNRGDAGFSPHRDRQPDDAASSFRPDGSAMYTTCWVALTDATPENSCLYVIPRHADPGYWAGDPEDEGAPDPLAAALHDKAAYQAIRALPTPAGGANVFTHRIIHWGSAGRAGAPVPRVSMSWGCADDGYEPPYLDRSHLPFPPLPLRLALIGAQMIIYHERFPANARLLHLFYQAFQAHAPDFEPGYRKKVMAEFVAATKDLAAGAGAAPAGGQQKAANGAAAQANGAAKAARQAPGVAGHGVNAAASAKGRKREQGEAQHQQQRQDKETQLQAQSGSREEAEESDESDEGSQDLAALLAGAGAGAGAGSGDDDDALEEAMLDAMLQGDIDALDDDFDDFEGGGGASSGGGAPAAGKGRRRQQQGGKPHQKRRKEAEAAAPAQRTKASRRRR